MATAHILSVHCLRRQRARAASEAQSNTCGTAKLRAAHAADAFTALLPHSWEEDKHDKAQDTGGWQSEAANQTATSQNAIPATNGTFEIETD